MLGLLADVNVQGHISYLRRLLEKLELWAILTDYTSLTFATFTTLQLPRDLDDRSLWNYCQQNGWVLLTENRNHEDWNSLSATMLDSWQCGHLPVITVASKSNFENSSEYAIRVAEDIAELLFGIAMGEYRDRSRIYVPL